MVKNFFKENKLFKVGKKLNFFKVFFLLKLILLLYERGFHNEELKLKKIHLVMIKVLSNQDIPHRTSSTYPVTFNLGKCLNVTFTIDFIIFNLVISEKQHYNMAN